MGKIKGAIVVNTDRCKGCSLCVVACPKDVIALTAKAVNVHGYQYAEAVRPDDCIGCASCGIVCPDGCISVYRKKWRINTMAEQEVKLMKGNEALAHAAIRCGCDGYFGYPITPQTEVIETLSELKPWETTGMVVLQAESEVASINMLYGGGGSGKRVMTSSSSPGVSLMQEGISYMAGAEVPGLIVDVQRGGPGLGTIQPSQSDYFQATRGGGNGDYYILVLAPNSVQEMADFVDLSFELAFKYRIPAMILSDGVIGQMMEKVVLPPFKPRRTNEEIIKECPWASTGCKGRKPVVITSLELKPEIMEQRNLQLQEKYRKIRENEVRYETKFLDDAEYMIVAFGSAARIAEKTIELARAEGIKVGLFRPITLWPFPERRLQRQLRSSRVFSLQRSTPA